MYIDIQREFSFHRDIGFFPGHPTFPPPLSSLLSFYTDFLSPTVLYPKQSNLEPVAAAPTCDCQVTIYIPAHLYNNLLTRYVFLARETLSQFRAFLPSLIKKNIGFDIVANGLISCREISIFFYKHDKQQSNKLICRYMKMSRCRRLFMETILFFQISQSNKIYLSLIFHSNDQNSRQLRCEQL